MRYLLVLLLGLLSAAPAFAVDIAYRAYAVNSSNAATTLACNKPTGTTTGDLVVAVVGHNGQETIADNNGATPFTLAYESWDAGSPFGATMTVFSRLIQGGDPATYSFTADTSDRMTVLCITFSDPNTSTTFDVSPAAGTLTTDSDAGTTTSSVDITTLSANAIHLIIAMRDSSTNPNYVDIAGYTRLGAATAGTGEAMEGYYKVIAAAGATGAKTITHDATDGYLAQSFAVKNNVPATAATGAVLLLGVGR
jgi:hypothetical protein